ncbi:MAG: 1,4-dihydroxy-2-naphthoate octaprenyltransferase [Natronomonas sp.]|jgi:1,4-dihydroxy-2-naphthoate octaprenyltransferase
MAARPQTLPAAAAPVIVGVGLAVQQGVFAPLPALAALVGAELIQIGTNFANDYYDAVKGTDAADREGFTRVTAGGLIEPKEVKWAMILTYGLAILVGVYLVSVGGVPIVLVGLGGIASGILYTGGPYPFGYYGLGDLFVFVWFGVVAVVGTYYVQAVAAAGVGAFPTWIPAGANALPAVAVVASLPIAALTTAILVVNNVRDLESDEAAGKYTLAVILGYGPSRAEYVGLLALAYLTPIWLRQGFGFGRAVVLPLGTLPYAAVVTHTVLTETSGEALNPALSRTGKLLFAFAVLYAVGMVI